MRKYDQSFLLVRHGNIVSLIFYSYDLSDILTGRELPHGGAFSCRAPFHK